VIEITVNMYIFIISLLIFSSISCIIAIVLSIFCLVDIKSIQKSTHKVEMVPYDPNWASDDEKFKEFEENASLDDPEEDLDELEEEKALDLRNLI